MFLYTVVVLSLVATSKAGSAIWPEPVTSSGHDGVVWVPNDLRASFHCGDDLMAWDVTASGFSTDQSFYGRSQLRLTELLGGWQASLGFTSDSRDERCDDALSEDEALRAAVKRTLTEVSKSAFVPWKFHSRASNFEPELLDDAPFLQALQISQRHCPNVGFQPAPFFDGDESYELKIEDGVARVKSNSTIGTLNALRKSAGLPAFLSCLSRVQSTG